MLEVEFLGGFAQYLGLRTVEATGDRVVLELELRPELQQPHGIVHGGVHTTLVETAASVGATLWFGDEGRVVGVSNQTDFLRAARGGRLVATATPIHRGRLQQLWLVEVTGEDDRTVARGQVRLQNLRTEQTAGR
ncbi:MAG: PaaI family thioesterase [Actinomycetes bacterium]